MDINASLQVLLVEFFNISPKIGDGSGDLFCCHAAIFCSGQIG